MGTICANNFEKEEGTETVDTYKNSVYLQVQLGGHCTLSLVMGHYKQHRSDALMVVTELKNIQHCDPIRDYTPDPDKAVQSISSMRKTFYKAQVGRTCPYKKMLVCVLGQYGSEERSEYIQQFRNMLREVLQSSRDLTLQLLNTIEGIHTVPNQLLLDVLLGQLVKTRSVIKFTLITTQKKMLNLYKYQLLKTEAYTIKSVLE